MSTDVPVLLYHSVLDDPAPKYAPWAIGTALFAEHLEVIKDSGREVISFAKLADYLSRGIDIPKNSVVITFDDGLRDFATNAWPLLDFHDMEATLYVTAGYIGGRSKWLEDLDAGQMNMLDTAGLQELYSAGLDIGSHSMTHPQLDVLSRKKAWDEIYMSKVILENILGNKVTSFAYPHGYHDEAVKKMVQRAGYRSAAAVRNGLSHNDDDPFAISRYTILGNCTTQQLQAVLSGDGVSRTTPGEKISTKLWRTYRRTRALRIA